MVKIKMVTDVIKFMLYIHSPLYINGNHNYNYKVSTFLHSLLVNTIFSSFVFEYNTAPRTVHLIYHISIIYVMT